MVCCSGGWYGVQAFGHRTFGAVGMASQGPIRDLVVGKKNNPPVANDATATVAENVASGTVLVTVTASDPDPGDVLTYAITGGNAAGLFAINPASGAISLASGKTLDYETA